MNKLDSLELNDVPTREPAFKQPRYSYDQVETAIALFSAIDEYTLLASSGLPVSHPHKPSEITVRKRREELGASETRRACIGLADICERTWLALSEDERDGITWDWEFVPAFVLHCVNWHDWQETTRADPAELAQAYLNEDAKHVAFQRD